MVAEGVEREAELEALLRLGCHGAQGLLFSRAVPSSAVDALVSSRRDWLFGMPAVGAVVETPSGAVRDDVREKGPSSPEAVSTR